MLAEWSVECGADDPVLVVPWATPEESGGPAFVDLRENPYDLDHVAEAEQHPALLHALRALNAPRSPVFTAKCDAWDLGDEERASLLQELNFQGLDLQPAEAGAGFGSYIDILFRERSLYVSFHAQEQRMMRLERLLGPVASAQAKAECVLRPAFVDLPGTPPGEGFAISLYVFALGLDAADAYAHWGPALAEVVAVLRGREFAAS